MRRLTNLLGPALVAAGSDANMFNRRGGNGSSVMTLSSSTASHDFTALHAPSAISPVAIPGPAYEMGSSLPIPSDTPTSSFHHVPPHLPASPLVPIYTNRSSTISPSATPTVVTYTASGSPPPFPNITSVHANSSIPTGVCTGCVIAAYGPVTTSYEPGEFYNPWTSTVVTETILTEYSTYMYNNTVETVVTEQRTVNQTKTLTGTDGRLITRATPTFTVQPTPGVIVHLDAGPTYVIYNRLSGAVDDYHEIYWPEDDLTQGYCSPTVTPLTSWQPASTATKEWSYFIATHTGELPESMASDQPVPLPSKLIEYLKQDPDIQTQFRDSDIATCSFSRPPESFWRPVLGTSAPAAPPPSPVPIFLSPLTGTYLATSFESTSVHITVRGCLRCQDTETKDVADPTMSNKIAQPTPTNDDHPDEHDNNIPSPSQPDRPAENTAKPTQGGGKTLPSIPDVVNTFIHDNPSIWTHGNPGATATKSVTIGGVVFPVNTPKPTQAEPDRPNEDNHNAVPPVIVIGSETMTQGQTKTINGVPVVVPTDGGGTRIVVDGSTVAYNPATTQGLPVLIVGGGAVTANSRGEYVLGSETLKPGGPPITINGNTASMAPNGMAIVNGATQTIANVPALTRAPALTVGSQAVSATVVGGSTVFVVAPGHTLSAGSTLVVDGTTYSMPAEGHGSTIVVNGQTSILNVGQSAITLDGGRSVTVQVISGTTAYVLAPDQTLTPGGVLTISGTTYSMPIGAYGSVIVIDGVTTTLATDAGITAAPALTINGVTYTHTVRDGTTEYILNDGTTLAPGSSIEIDGTTYSLDEQGTALIINGQTSTMPKLPKSNSASTTHSGSASTTRSRDAGDLIASGIGETSKAVGVSTHVGGFDKWVESLVIGAAGWLTLLL